MTLFRDNVLVQELSKRSGAADVHPGDVMVWFTDQPAAFAHGHKWKIAWYWFGPNANNGSLEFTIP